MTGDGTEGNGEGVKGVGIHDGRGIGRQGAEIEGDQ